MVALGLVESLSFEVQPQSMYNLTVAEAHTFFVGQGVWLVHNAKCGGKIPIKGGGTSLPSGVQWANAHNIKHPDWNPPDVQSKLAQARKNLGKRV